MGKYLCFFISMAFILVSCGSSSKTISKKTVVSKKNTGVNSSDGVTIADKIVWTAVTYKGTPYKYGGITHKGMDCSGLVHTAFKKRNVHIPRTSYLMYNKGVSIPLRQVKRGDLLFFRTSKSNRRVNHVGLVTSVDGQNVKFIHSTSSKGVIVTSLRSNYWNKAFVKAKRLL